MAKLAFQIRVVLFIVGLGKPKNKPLPKMRRLTFLFMRLMNRVAGINTPGFYSTTNKSFVASGGHTIRLKVYTPFKSESQLPVWVYFHGGGFALGHYNARNKFTKAIAAKAGCIVVSVDYRLAPEHPFPAGVNDCYAAVQWVAKHAHEFGGDGNRIAVGGESAGGNLSAVISIMARDKGAPKILHQTLIYPAVDMQLNYTSIDKYAEGYMLTKDLIHQFHQAYLPAGIDLKNPYHSPIHANMIDLPPATVITAEFDPLVDEGDLYAEKLKQAGVPVVHKHYKGMIHDFTVMMGRWLPESVESVDLIAAEIKQVFENDKGINPPMR